jgi:hypothetical protein
MLLHNLAHVALVLRVPARAAALFAEGLTVSLERRDRRLAAACVGGLGAVAAAEARPVRAAQLLGAAGAILRAAQLRSDGVDQEALDRAAAARAQLGAAAFAEAQEHGRALTLEQAASAALRPGPSDPS